MKALVADDDAASRILLQKVLTKWGYDVVTASGGEEAWKILTSDNPPDIVVLDWMMPELDGVEVCRRVRALDLSSPPYLILLTSRSDKQDIATGLEAGAADYVQKPFTEEELVEFARKLLIKREARLESQRRPTVRVVAPSTAETAAAHEFCVPGGAFVSDGHSWARIEPTGQVRVGLDDFARKALRAVKVSGLQQLVVAGGVGAQNAFVELSDHQTARELERRVCQRLGLFAPDSQQQGRFDRFGEVVFILASLCASLARMGLQLRTMERPEVAELGTLYGEEACSSSTMPNKRNPEPAERVQGLADLARGHADTMLSLRTADHRDSTRIPVLYTAVPGAFLLVSRALESIAAHLETMQVNRDVMRANLDHPNVLGQAAAERVMIALYRKTGRKHWAHTRLSECSAISTRTRRPLRQVIEEMADLTAHLSAAELDLLFELSTYTGTAALQVEQAVARIMERSGAAREPRGATTA